MTNREENNRVYISGEVVSDIKFSHETYGENFYECRVQVKRLSGAVDVLPVMISERIMPSDFGIGKSIYAFGQFRSYNKVHGEKSKLELYVFIRSLLNEPHIRNDNVVVLIGYICKTPLYRITPLNREITDLFLAVNRGYNKTDYIPMIVWGRNARFAGDLAVGDCVQIQGRIQSREYEKVRPNGEKEVRTAYEVSVSQIVIIDGDSEADMWADLINEEVRL